MQSLAATKPTGKATTINIAFVLSLIHILIKTITVIDYLPDVALVTVNNIPNSPEKLSAIMNEISDRHITEMCIRDR